MEAWLLPSLIVFVAALSQACTGFGFSILATPLLLFLLPPQTTIQINIILSIVISLYLVPGTRGDIDRSLLRHLMAGSMPGALLGVWVFVQLDTGTLKLAVGWLILLLTALLMLRLRINQSRARDHVAGSLSGLFTTSLGMPGVPLLLYLAGTGIDKAVLRSTTLAYFLFIYPVALAMQLAVGQISTTIWGTALMLLPALALGVFVGKRLFHRINQARFRQLTMLILLATALYLLLGPR